MTVLKQSPQSVMYKLIRESLKIFSKKITQYIHKNKIL